MGLVTISPALCVPCSRTLLYVDALPNVWLHYLGCGVMGMITSYVFITSTQYYTDYASLPVRQIAAASTTGHGTNIIAGVLEHPHRERNEQVLLFMSCTRRVHTIVNNSVAHTRTTLLFVPQPART